MVITSINWRVLRFKIKKKKKAVATQKKTNSIDRGEISNVIADIAFVVVVCVRLCLDCARDLRKRAKGKKYKIFNSPLDITIKRTNFHNSIPSMCTEKTMAHCRHQHHRHFVHTICVAYNGILLGFIAFIALSTISSGKCQQQQNM